MSPEYVYHSALPTRLLTLSTAQMGIFAEVGPLNCFVSQQVRVLSLQVSHCILLVLHLIPGNIQLLHPDLKFDPSSNPPSYTSQDQVKRPNTVLFSSYLIALA